jgi:hypothetical protein
MRKLKNKNKRIGGEGKLERGREMNDRGRRRGREGRKKNKKRG